MHARRQGIDDHGHPRQAGALMSGEPFHRCTHTALSPNGDHLYISDGYGNARVHKFTPDGKLLMSWGEPGTDPGQFNIPHNICCDPDGWIYVADRENHRVQVFDGNGTWETQWNNLHRPNGMCLATGRKPALLYRRRWTAGRDQPGLAEYRGAGQHPHAQRPRYWRGLASRMPASRRGSSPRRTASPSTARQHLCRRTLRRSWSRFSEGPAPAKRRVIHRLEKLAA